ncbi:MAG: DUF1573 domain-containing protein [Planctomycetaceae bacterium]|jgi:hypothetical protein|nr:DUF1573 domain-containing protein [Planctomycetaceae bacterium]
MIYRIFLPAIISLLFISGSITAAESWGTDLFQIKKHDFGRVTIGADVVYPFVMENVYQQDIKILGVHSSCGCTIPSLSTNLLKAGEKGTVFAKFNTNGQHTREKSATLTVDLETEVKGQLLRESVLLYVSGYIRSDVVLTPGIVEFGSIPAGQTEVRTVQLEYAGRSDWALTKVERSNPFIHAKAEEIERSTREIAYRITVTIKDTAPIGYIRDVLRFATNELSNSSNGVTEIVLPVQGVVTAPVQAKPTPLMIGLLTPGETVSKNIVVRSKLPFRIMEVTSQDKRFRFTFSEQESAIQLVSVLFSAKKTQTEESQNITDQIRIRTNLPDQEFVTIDALALLTPKELPTVTPSPESLPVSASLPSLPIVEPMIEPIIEQLPLDSPLSTEKPIIPSGKAKFGTPQLF